MGEASVPKKELREGLLRTDNKAGINNVPARTACEFSVVSSFAVYEAPYEGSYAKKLRGRFTALRIINQFVQVKYVKKGYGLVKGYVPLDRWIEAVR